MHSGEGGNDLLGNKKQVKGQQLERGNKALMANIALGIPVRLFRRNSDDKAAMNSVLFYDGLYDVVSVLLRSGKGIASAQRFYRIVTPANPTTGDLLNIEHHFQTSGDLGSSYPDNEYTSYMHICVPQVCSDSVYIPHTTLVALFSLTHEHLMFVVYYVSCR